MLKAYYLYKHYTFITKHDLKNIHFPFIFRLKDISSYDKNIAINKYKRMILIYKRTDIIYFLLNDKTA